MNVHTVSRPTSRLLVAAGLAVYALGACQSDSLVDPLDEMRFGSRYNEINNDAAVAMSGDFVTFEQRIGGETATDTSARSRLELDWEELSYGRTELTLDGPHAQGTWLRGNYRVVDTGTTLMFYNTEAGGDHAPNDRASSLRMKLDATHDTLYLRGAFDDSPVRMSLVRTGSLR